MSTLFNEILYRPLFNLLVGIYNIVPGHDFGVAIILLTILIRVLFVPLSLKSQISQRAISQLQPKLSDLQTKHKEDKQALAQATMALYKEHKVNPLSGCLPVLIQLPVIWALYRVFIRGVNDGTLANLYSFVKHPGTISNISLGFIDLAHRNPAMAILAGLLQFAQAWFNARLQKSTAAASANNPTLKMTQQMMYFFPIMITVIAWSLPAGLVLYWIATTAFSIFELLYIRRKYAQPHP